MKKMTHLWLPTENLEHLLDESLIKELQGKNSTEATATLNMVLKLIFSMGKRNLEEAFGVLPEFSEKEKTLINQLAQSMNKTPTEVRSEIWSQGLAKLTAEHNLSEVKSSDSFKKK